MIPANIHYSCSYSYMFYILGGVRQDITRCLRTHRSWKDAMTQTYCPSSTGVNTTLVTAKRAAPSSKAEFDMAMQSAKSSEVHDLYSKNKHGPQPVDTCWVSLKTVVLHIVPYLFSSAGRRGPMAMTAATTWSFSALGSTDPLNKILLARATSKSVRPELLNGSWGGTTPWSLETFGIWCVSRWGMPMTNQLQRVLDTLVSNKPIDMSQKFFHVLSYAPISQIQNEPEKNTSMVKHKVYCSNKGIFRVPAA